MNNKQLFEALKDVEFCDMDTGCYYRMAGVYTEAGKRVVSIETVATQEGGAERANG